jgi:hypothetical protein
LITVWVVDIWESREVHKMFFAKVKFLVESK